MKKQLVFIVMFLILSISVSLSISAEDLQETPLPGMRGKPINLPDVSALANIIGYYSDDKTDKDRNNLLINEVETAFQGYLYPEVRSDIIIAMHRNGDNYETEICEAKANFLNLGYGFSGEVGKIHIDFGKINKLHTHHLLTTDRPVVLQKFFGEDELAGQGAVLKYLIPLPFYTQFQVGFWKIFYDSQTFTPSDKTYTTRLNSSFEVGENKELELGLSALKGRGPEFEDHKDNVEVIGADITFKWFPSSYEKWTIQNEWMHLRRKMTSENLNRDGFYSFINYRANKYWDYGIRIDYSENAYSTISYERQFSFIVTKHLTETSYLRFTAKNKNIDGKKITEFWSQISFGIGPHSHELE